MLRLPRFLRWGRGKALGDLVLARASDMASPIAPAIGLAMSAWDGGEA